jgi:hypothetical protein
MSIIKNFYFKYTISLQANIPKHVLRWNTASLSAISSFKRRLFLLLPSSFVKTDNLIVLIITK